LTAGLWVEDSDHRTGWLGSNPHTFPGRFLVYWAHRGEAYSASLNGLLVVGERAAIWLEGFLAGAEPPGWFGDDFDYTEDDPRTQEWRRAIERFSLTGTWGPGRVCEEGGHPMLPSEPLGFRCIEHGGIASFPRIRHDPPGICADP
jgi:hypothetical protein